MPIPRVPDELRHRPFTSAEAAAAGLGHHHLRSSPWRHLLRDVWAHAAVPETTEMRFAAVRLILPDHAVVCSLTAAWLHGTDVRRAGDLDVQVGYPKGRRRRRRDGLVVCQETLAPEDVVSIDGVKVTTPLRTAFDCARWLHGTDRIVVLDAFAHSGQVPVEELRRYMARMHRLRNLRRARALLDLVDPLAESPMETRLRMVLVDRGLPTPASQVAVLDDLGRFVGRVDLAYERVRLAIEYDGAWHWEHRRADDRRRAALREQGWEVLVFSADDVYGDPDGVAAAVDRVLQARARRYAA